MFKEEEHVVYIGGSDDVPAKLVGSSGRIIEATGRGMYRVRFGPQNKWWIGGSKLVRDSKNGTRWWV